MTTSYTHEQQVALDAAQRAARLCMHVRAELVEGAVLEKSDRSPVTVADFGAQALVCQVLRAAFPHDVIVAEEDAAELRLPQNAALRERVTRYVRQALPEASEQDVFNWIDAGGGEPSGRYWTLDPIDGTKGFLRNDQYAIALALIEHGQVQVGVLACPALPFAEHATSARGVLFSAVRGVGAQMRALNGSAAQPIHVLNDTDGPGMRFVESVEAAHGNHQLQEAIAQAVGVTQPALRMDSQAKYGIVARGEAVLYLRLPSPKSPDYRENIWDHAAGMLIAEEAGGRVTDMHGLPLDFTAGRKLVGNRGVVVSNGAVHAAALAALRQHIGQP